MKVKKLMTKVLYIDETGKRQVEEIYADTVKDLVFEERGIVGVGGKIIGLDNPVEVEVEVNEQ